MKKFFVFLMVALVAITCVFADEGYKDPLDKTASNGQAQIQILTTIHEEWPKFQLATTSGVTANVHDEVEGTLSTPVTATLTDANNSALTEADSGSVSVGFTINQISDSRTNDVYTLSIEVTDLVLMQALNDAQRATFADATTASASDATRKFVVVAAAPAISKQTVSNITMDDTTDGELEVTYNGKKVKAGASSVVPLGIFTAAWTKNSNAQAGDYEAHITLTVTAQ